MLLLILFAFIGGVVTILSPCILPVLPIVLSGTAGGGKKRPLGIVAGFVLSFTFFTLALSAIVRATGISADSLRTLAVVIVAGFGLSLLFPQFQVMMERMFSRLAGSVTQKNADRDGFGGGMLIGASLGLVWTPCVGPILASIITLAATSTVNAAAVLITLAYAIGTGIPLLGITYGGRKLLTNNPWLVRNTARIQQTFGVLMILTAIGIQFNIDRTFQTYVLEIFPQYGAGLTSIEDNEAVQRELDRLQGDDGEPSSMLDMLRPDYGEAPELIPGGEWFNTEPFTLADQRGKVVLVDFWTYTCINCIRTLPYLKSWHDAYADDGLVIIGVHAPEFEFEKSADNVRDAIADFEIEYPVMQDNEFATWRAYSNRYWPAKYLVDKDGRIRYTHFGEGKYDETERMIQELLEEAGSETTDEATHIPSGQNYARTPELYLGYLRIQALDSPERIRPDTAATYTDPARLGRNLFSLNGEWMITGEYAEPNPEGELTLNFESKNVFLVMRPVEEGTEARVQVLLDGQIAGDGVAGADVTDGFVTVDIDRLYTLIELDTPGAHTLKLRFPDGNVEAFAFTFG